MISVLLSTLAATLVAAAPSQVDVIAVGLADPRKLTYDDGRLYVAEAGVVAPGAAAGSPKITFTAGVSVIELHYGDSSSSSSSSSDSSSRKRNVESSDSSSSSSSSDSSSSSSWTAVRGSSVERVVSNLDSYTTCNEGSGCDATGATSVAVHGDELYFLSGGSYLLAKSAYAPASSAISDNTRTLGRVLGVTLGDNDDDDDSHSKLHGIADVGAFTLGSMFASGNVQGPNVLTGDSNPNGLAFDADSNTFYVADAAANMIVAVHNGLLRNVAFFPRTCTAQTPGFGDAVTTGVTIGPDGFLYVSTLELREYVAPGSCGVTGPLGHSSIYRINPKLTGHHVTPADIFATGFTMLVDVHYSHANEAFYAVEFASSPGFQGGAVVEVQVKESHGQVVVVERRVLGEGALTNPGGVATDDEGNVFVSDCTGLGACPARIVRVNF